MDEPNEDDFEQFHLDNEFTDGTWIGGEFFGNKKQKTKLTKEQVTYTN
jgi:hypothetical protein